MNELAHEAASLGAPILVSMGSLFDPKKCDFHRIGMAPWFLNAALDSAGFSAMLRGGYRWSVYDHVELVATNSSRVWGDDEAPGPCDLPFPWAWWAAMDFCCEQEIAPNRLEVERRMALTIETYEETLDAVASYWWEGFNWLTRPLPTLQGRRPADYLWSARALADVWRRRPLAENEQEDGRDYSELPELIGVGSVCGREIHGPEGVLPVLDVLHAELPPETRLHLFGVKGDVLPFLWRYGSRVHSIDSMAWDDAARKEAQKIRKRRGVFDSAHPEFFSCDLEHRRKHMRTWYQTQQRRLSEKSGHQIGLFEGRI